MCCVLLVSRLEFSFPFGVDVGGNNRSRAECFVQGRSVGNIRNGDFQGQVHGRGIVVGGDVWWYLNVTRHMRQEDAFSEGFRVDTILRIFG